MILSFNNDPALKAEHVAQAGHHAAADMLRSGTYGVVEAKQFHACSIGCFAHDIDPEFKGNLHGLIAKTRALPEWLILLQDSLFEGLPAGERGAFHVELAKRIPVGVDLEPVRHWLADDRIDRMLTLQRTALEAQHAHGVHEAIQRTVAVLEVTRRAHEAAAGGNTCELSAAESAESAESAARSAARSAWAAWSAAWSAWCEERDSLFSALDRAGGV